MMPIINEQEATFFERPFRTLLAAVVSSGIFGESCDARAGSSCNTKAFCGSAVARAAPVEHSAVPGSTRAAPAEHSAASGQARAMLFEHSICGSMAVSSGHFEQSSALGRARAAISSQFSNILWLQGELARPFRAICGYKANSGGHFEPTFEHSEAPG